jgi:NADH-dependent peroxiredoxin subunit C
MKIGQTIPSMDLEVFHNQEEKIINTSEFRGKWLILIFYPADFSFVCPTELEEAAEKYDQFKELGAELISISTDTTYVHKAWHDISPAIKKIKFPMVADPTGKLCKAFGTYIEDEGLSLRGTFIVNPEGVVKSLEINHNDIGRSSNELLRKLQAAKYVSEHSGEVCPVNWTPGQNTLKPGLDLVGKI